MRRYRNQNHRYFENRYFENRRFHFNHDRAPLALDPVGGKIGGVCAGLARYFDLSSVFIRVGAILLLCMAPGAALSAYGIAYLILDKRACY